MIDTLPSLQEQGIEQLYPSPPDQRLQPQPQGQSHGQSQGQSQGQSEGQSQGQDEAPDEIPAGTDDAPAAATSMDGNGTQSEWTLDRAFYLQKIAKSLLLNFMELVGVLSVDPAQVCLFTSGGYSNAFIYTLCFRSLSWTYSFSQGPNGQCAWGEG